MNTRLSKWASLLYYNLLLCFYVGKTVLKYIQVTYSDGVTVLSDPPLAGAITTATLSDDDKSMHVEWEKVISAGQAELLFSWSLSTTTATQLTPWRLTPGVASGDDGTKVRHVYVCTLHNINIYNYF